MHPHGWPTLVNVHSHMLRGKSKLVLYFLGGPILMIIYHVGRTWDNVQIQFASSKYYYKATHIVTFHSGTLLSFSSFFRKNKRWAGSIDGTCRRATTWPLEYRSGRYIIHLYIIAFAWSGRRFGTTWATASGLAFDTDSLDEHAAEVFWPSHCTRLTSPLHEVYI